jgi:hypothetical protein
MQAFEKADSGGTMEILSDHPTNQHRIADLVAHMRGEPQLFSRYSSNMAMATPLTAAAARTAAAAATTTALRPAKKKGKGMFPPGSGYKY